ncbi:MAG: hypothetical protein ACREKS_11535 [Candidatus Rokuibacteriota bacterium]
MSRRLLVPGLVLGLITFGWSLCAPPFAGAQPPKRGGTLRVSYGSEVAHLAFRAAPGYERACSTKGYTDKAEFEVHGDTVWLDT